MKNCNNCGTINIDSAVQCTDCHMEGQFTFHSLPIKKVELKEDIQCVNCGTIDRGEGAKCLQCHFPIPKKGLEEEGSSISLKPNFKAAQ
ncbi:MAG: hypothetical protein AB8F94_16530 [Saprospiraceae bacterium]